MIEKTKKSAFKIVFSSFKNCYFEVGERVLHTKNEEAVVWLLE